MEIQATTSLVNAPAVINSNRGKCYNFNPNNENNQGNIGNGIGIGSSNGGVGEIINNDESSEEEPNILEGLEVGSKEWWEALSKQRLI